MAISLSERSSNESCSGDLDHGCRRWTMVIQSPAHNSRMNMDDIRRNTISCHGAYHGTCLAATGPVKEPV